MWILICDAMLIFRTVGGGGGGGAHRSYTKQGKGKEQRNVSVNICYQFPFCYIRGWNVRTASTFITFNEKQFT